MLKRFDFYENIGKNVNIFLNYVKRTQQNIQDTDLERLKLWAEEEFVKVKCVKQSPNKPTSDIISVYNKWKYQQSDDVIFQKYRISEIKKSKAGFDYLKIQLSNTNDTVNMSIPSHFLVKYPNVFIPGRIICMNVFKATMSLTAIPTAFVVELTSNDNAFINELFSFENEDYNLKFEIIQKNEYGFKIDNEGFEFTLSLPATHSHLRGLLNEGDSVAVSNILHIDDPSGLYFTVDTNSMFFRLPTNPHDSRYFRLSLYGRINTIAVDTDLKGAKVTLKDERKGNFSIVTFSNSISMSQREILMHCRVGQLIWMFGISWSDSIEYKFDGISRIYNLDKTPAFYFSSQRRPVSIKRLVMTENSELIEATVVKARFFPVDIHTNCGCVLTNKKCLFCNTEIHEDEESTEKLLLILTLDDGTAQIKAVGISEDLEMCPITINDYNDKELTEGEVIEKTKRIHEENQSEFDNRIKEKKKDNKQQKVDDMIKALSSIGVTVDREDVESEVGVEEEDREDIVTRMRNLFISQQSVQVINENIANEGRKIYMEYQENWMKKVGKLVGQTFVFGISRQNFEEFGDEAKLIEWRIDFAARPGLVNSIDFLMADLNNNREHQEFEMMFTESTKMNSNQ